MINWKERAEANRKAERDVMRKLRKELGWMTKRESREPDGCNYPKYRDIYTASGAVMHLSRQSRMNLSSRIY